LTQSIPNWSAARDAAAEIADVWRREAGPGGAIVAFDADAIRVEEAGGVESLATKQNFSADSVVRYASITKHLFSGRVLAHADLIGLDDRLGDHLPMLRGDMAEVLVGRALDMTSGLPDVRETLALLGLSLPVATEADPILAFIGELGALNFPTGSEISYSNTGYRLVEAALAARGPRFADLIRDDVARPLGVDFHAPELWSDPVPNLIPGYWRAAQGWQLGNAGMHLSASGNLCGSLRSLVIWLQALLADRGPARGLLARLAAPRALADGRLTAYGLGLAWTRLGRHWVGHGGAHVGYRSHFLLDPAAAIGVALVSNCEDTAAATLALTVMAALTGETLPPRSNSLPNGLFAADTGPFWLEVADGTATFLGTAEPLYQSGNGAVSLSPHLPMRLRRDGTAIAGDIGHVARRFLPVRPDHIIESVQGTWVAPTFHAHFDIVGDHLETGAGPARMRMPLVPLGNGRLLAEGRDGPSTRRFAMAFSGDTVELCLNRSRVLRFERQ
jgi:CubicO group peptidase (beta-lactamase class C family)